MCYRHLLDYNVHSWEALLFPADVHRLHRPNRWKLSDEANAIDASTLHSINQQLTETTALYNNSPFRDVINPTMSSGFYDFNVGALFW